VEITTDRIDRHNENLSKHVFKLKLKYNLDYRLDTAKLKSIAKCER